MARAPRRGRPRAFAALAAATLAFALLAGCLGDGGGGSGGGSGPGPGPSPTSAPAEPCAAGYVVGCDGNADARRMLEEYGLHQVSNTSLTVSAPLLEDGLLTWREGGFGHPVTYRAYGIPEGRHAAWRSPDGQGTQPQTPAGGQVLYGQTPLLDFGGPDQRGDSRNSTVWLWRPATGAHRQVEAPADGAFITTAKGFDGRWALLRELAQQDGLEDGWLALDVGDGATARVWDVLPSDGSPSGTPLAGVLLAGGAAYCIVWSQPAPGQADSRLVEVDLATGARVERLHAPDAAVTEADASARFVVLAVPAADGSALLAMDRRAPGGWSNVARDPSASQRLPAVGGDWAVYMEARGTAAGLASELVAVHLPTGQARTLLANQNADFDILAWDTDGERVALRLEAEDGSRLAHKGTQVYWMDLPAVPDPPA